jgi:hypothetical protein
VDISRSIAGNAAWARLLGKPASGQNERNEEWVTYPDGRRALLDTLKAPLRDPAGTVIGLVGVCREIQSPR